MYKYVFKVKLRNFILFCIFILVCIAIILWYKRDLVKNIMRHLKTIFTKKEQNILKNISKKRIATEELKTREKKQENTQENTQEKTNTPPPKNTLKTIVDSILMNSTIQKAVGIYDIVVNYKNNINKLGRIPKNCYKQVLEKLGGNSKEKTVSRLRRSIMEKLPANPNIENILDTNYKIKKIKNTQDRESVVNYLSKS